MIDSFRFKEAQITMTMQDGWFGIFKGADDTYTIAHSHEDEISVEKGMTYLHAISRAIDVYANNGIDDMNYEIEALLQDFQRETGKNLLEYVEEHDWLKARVEHLEHMAYVGEEIALDLAAMSPIANELLDNYGKPYADSCAMCGSEVNNIDSLDQHSSGCVWRRAKEWAESRVRETHRVA